MHCDDVVSPFQELRTAPPARSEDAGCMGLVDHQYGLVTPCQGGDSRKVRLVAIQAVNAFTRDPYPTGPACGAPPQDRVVDGLDVIVAGAGDLGTAAAQPVMDAR